MDEVCKDKHIRKRCDRFLGKLHLYSDVVTVCFTTFGDIIINRFYRISED